MYQTKTKNHIKMESTNSLSEELIFVSPCIPVSTAWTLNLF